MAAEREHADQLPLVLEYLESHPDIFLDNPHLLSNLNIPHLTGKRVHSLIEYQVEKLREENQQLSAELEELNTFHEHCEDLGVKGYELALRMTKAKSVESLYDQFFVYLKNEYACSKLLIYYFTGERPHADYRGLRFRPTHSRLRYLFSGLFNRNKPLCDSLQSEYLDRLFGKEATKIRSTVALPILSEDDLGLMVIGSEQYDAYSRGFPIHLLSYLKEIYCKRFKEII